MRAGGGGPTAKAAAGLFRPDGLSVGGGDPTAKALSGEDLAAGRFSTEGGAARILAVALGAMASERSG